MSLMGLNFLQQEENKLSLCYNASLSKLIFSTTETSEMRVRLHLTDAFQ